METIIQNADQLQRQALAAVKQMGLDSQLSKYGQFNVVGSAVYNLMTWRDIDFDLVMPAVPDNKTYWDIVQCIFTVPGVKKLTLVDNRDLEEKDRPKSMYIGVSYKDAENETWKLDIRVLSKDSVTTDSIAELIKLKLTEDSRLHILEIKSQVHTNPKYHKGFSSVDIYNAVLLNGVKDLSGFEKYLATLGKSL